MIIPSEWYRHSATQLYWPSNNATWSAKQRNKVVNLYCRLIEELHFFEPIHLFVDDLKTRDQVMQILSGRAVDLDRVIVHQQETGNIWARDCGSVFMKEGGEFVIGDYDAEAGSRVKETAFLTRYLSEKFGVQRVEGELILNNSWLDSNGAGALFILESPMVRAHEKIGLSKSEMEHKLKQHLGCEDIFWVKYGSTEAELPVRWLNKDTVLVTICEDQGGHRCSALQENLEFLQSISFKNGKKLNTETLIQPTSHTAGNSMSTHGSYAGFYITNGAVFMPVFSQKEDTIALEVLKKYFPARKIISIDCTDLATVNGSIRRITLPLFGSKVGLLS